MNMCRVISTDVTLKAACTSDFISFFHFTPWNDNTYEQSFSNWPLYIALHVSRRGLSHVRRILERMNMFILFSAWHDFFLVYPMIILLIHDNIEKFKWFSFCLKQKSCISDSYNLRYCRFCELLAKTEKVMSRGLFSACHKRIFITFSPRDTSFSALWRRTVSSM